MESAIGDLRRQGIDIDRDVMSRWARKLAWLMAPLGERLLAYILEAPKIHGDDTPVTLLGNGNGSPAESWLREALPLAERAVQLAPQRASNVDTVAGVLLLLGRHADAEAQYRRALQLDPLAVHSWAGLSDVFVATGRLGEAQAMWRQLLSANPGNVSLRVAIGQELLLRGDRHNAEVIVRDALRLEPGNVAARTVLDDMLRTAPK